MYLCLDIECYPVLSLHPSVDPSSLTFHSLSRQQLQTFNSNFIYRYVIEVRSSSSDLVQVRSLNLGKKKEMFCANKCKT